MKGHERFRGCFTVKDQVLVKRPDGRADIVVGAILVNGEVVYASWQIGPMPLAAAEAMMGADSV